MYLILGSCKDINIGPTAIMALMVQEHTAKFGADIAVLLCFLSGCIILLFGILHLGKLSPIKKCVQGRGYPKLVCASEIRYNIYNWL